MWESYRLKLWGLFESYKIRTWGLFCKTAPTPPKNFNRFLLCSRRVCAKFNWFCANRALKFCEYSMHCYFRVWTRKNLDLLLLIVAVNLDCVDLFAQAKATKKFYPAFSKAGEGTGRAALSSAFLLLAFLCAYTVKEKRLTNFGIKNCLAFVTDARGAPLQYVQC